MDDVDRLHHKLIFIPDSYYCDMKWRRFLKNIAKRKKKWLFNFVTDPDVDPTNNWAERALRSSVIYKKISGVSRSEGREVLKFIRGHNLYAKDQGLRERILSQVLYPLSRQVLTLLLKATSDWSVTNINKI